MYDEGFRKFESNFFFFRHVIIPKELAKKIPKDRLLTEQEWRGMGVQQSQGWIHYMLHKPGEYLSILLKGF